MRSALAGLAAVLTLVAGAAACGEPAPTATPPPNSYAYADALRNAYPRADADA